MNLGTIMSLLLGHYYTVVQHEISMKQNQSLGAVFSQLARLLHLMLHFGSARVNEYLKFWLGFSPYESTHALALCRMNLQCFSPFLDLKVV